VYTKQPWIKTQPRGIHSFDPHPTLAKRDRNQLVPFREVRRAADRDRDDDATLRADLECGGVGMWATRTIAPQDPRSGFR
jgi:hypothetical protein